MANEPTERIVTTFNTQPDCVIRIIKGWLPKETADGFLEDIQQQVPFGEYFFQIYGKTVRTPRRMFFFGDTGIATLDVNGNPAQGIGYTYSKNKYPVCHWDTPDEVFYKLEKQNENMRIYDPVDVASGEQPVGEPVGISIHRLALAINRKAGIKIDSVLLNEYIGENSIAAHSDKEALGHYPADPKKDNAVYAISLGGRRVMRFRGKSTETKGEKFDTFVDHGDLVVMSGATQEHYTHEIPKLKPYQDYRVSITFRQIGM